MTPLIEGFYGPVASTISRVLVNRIGGVTTITDPILDYDPKSNRTQITSTDRLMDYVKKQQLTVNWLLETHAHTDHPSAAHYLCERVGGNVAISEKIVKVQRIFRHVFSLEHTFALDGSQFDHLLIDGETFGLGALTVQALHVPDYTPTDMVFQVADAIFLSDTLFMPDMGTARCDFPGGGAQQLYHSICKIFSFPAETHLCMCHDYPPAGRNPQWENNVVEQRAANIHVHDGNDLVTFVALRQTRDKTLAAPVLLLPSIQVNIRTDEFPPAEDNGVCYLKIPLNHL